MLVNKILQKRQPRMRHVGKQPIPDWKAVELDLDPDRPVRIVLPEKLKFEYFRIHLRV